MSVRIPDEHERWPDRTRLVTSDVRSTVELVDAAFAPAADRRAATPRDRAAAVARRLLPDVPAGLLRALERGDVLLVVVPNALPPISSRPTSATALRDLADDDTAPVDEPEPEPAANDEPIHMIEVLVVDVRGEPQTGIFYELTLPDGSVRTGRTGSDGHLRLGGLAQTGECTITFPEVAAPLEESA